MNKFRVASIICPSASPFQVQASAFHTTRVLERKKRTPWDSRGHGGSASSRRSNYYRKRERKLFSKRELLHNVSSFAEELFQSWRHGHHDDDNPSESRNSSWFREQLNYNGNRRGKSRNPGGKGFGRRPTGPQIFVDDDDLEFENTFRSTFGGNGYTYFFINDEEPPRRSSSRHSNYARFYWNYYGQHEEETESDNSDSDLASDRVALGLSSSGPISLDEVKTAYRACALKWHPDRHSGSSKTVAEEKFKLCSAAYQSLCDKLSLT